MAGKLDGKTAIITGAGRGIGREVALRFASEGARVIVNDLGVSVAGEGSDTTPAQEVVNEIKAKGGQALVNYADVSNMEQAEDLVRQALNEWGQLDILVNVAGILRDGMVFKMSEEDWDAVVAVHLKGHFVPTRWAAAYWREQVKAGETVTANVVNTSSTSGLLANPGQTNYGAAKSGIATFTQIAAKELSRYGVKVNCIAPAARTRLTEATPGLGDIIKAPDDAATFDIWDPANISPLVAYLATADCPFTGETFFVQGGQVRRFQSWKMAEGVEQDERWTVAGLQRELSKLATPAE